MFKNNSNLQDVFLNHPRKEKIPVTVHLMTGVKLAGVIKGFDSFAILLKHTTQELIYKHAISVIQPQKEVSRFLDLQWQMAEREDQKPQKAEIS
ncbi:MAG TPA: RNA chaperone Hfq [Nitrospiria bacterium]|nr:RNA chaperone Hfq [Nitrospiria bacterium]